METRKGHLDSKSHLKEIGEVRQTKAEEEPKIKETEADNQNLNEENIHCISESQTSNTS